ncbi:acetyl-CoA carboxylase biotin carboxylase subunit [Planctomyces bekefii]|uniref:biotin carboxylase n=1 Tax=Planctomyces bekefii TaxID=1653850 RepID=A0A5C6MD75_9PLAN|nr:acetyl-CoA carboxylase biotin carboxylase subunit [Planctomyces bekefii]
MKKVLIANRGEIAVRIIRACRELGLKTVAIHSTADRDSLHAKLADESICIGPGPSIKSYLRIPSVMSAVEVSGADAVHPGYGFLSENAEFARICREYKINFIGPDPEHIHALGNKVEARALAEKAKVPMLPGSRGVVRSEEEAEAVAKEVGYPLIIKAAAGGGGRGMKVVNKREDLLRQFQLAQAEAEAGFGNPDCFIERYCAKPRHIEVQLVADKHGNYAYLGERDCSIQRRHQKLVEEAPSPVLTPELRRQVGEAAVRLAKAVGYVSLGTAEFLYENGQFYFMEVNTRVQVEHTVTEQVTGIDLVKEQIRIAMGEKLSFDPNQVKLVGHSMECRINAEDPATFAPWPGKVTAYHEPGGPGVRVDGMLYAGYTVPSNCWMPWRRTSSISFSMVSKLVCMTLLLAPLGATNYLLTRSIYSPVRVSIFKRSPSLM